MSPLLFRSPSYPSILHTNRASAKFRLSATGSGKREGDAAKPCSCRVRRGYCGKREYFWVFSGLGS